MWEYKVVRLPAPADATFEGGDVWEQLRKLREDAERELNVLGAEGWEMTGQQDFTAFFKRLRTGQTYSIWARDELLEEGFDDLQKESKCQT